MKIEDINISTVQEHLASVGLKGRVEIFYNLTYDDRVADYTVRALEG